MDTQLIPGHSHLFLWLVKVIVLCAIHICFVQIQCVSCKQSKNDTYDYQQTDWESKTIVMTYLIPWTGQMKAGPEIGPAILPALEYIKTKELIPGYQIKMHWADTECNQLSGIKKILDLWLHHKTIDVIIGDGCSTVCIPLSYMASAWNIPMVSWGCAAKQFSDKSVHDRFSRVMGSGIDYIHVFTQILITFQWERVGIITSTSANNAELARALYNDLQRRNFTAFHYTIQSTGNQDHTDFNALSILRSIVRTLKNKVRIIICFIFDENFTNFVRLAVDEGMVNGYVFLTIENVKPFLLNNLPLGGLITVRIRSVNNKEDIWKTFVAEIERGFDNPAFADMPRASQQDQGFISIYGGDYIFYFFFNK